MKWWKQRKFRVTAADQRAALRVTATKTEVVDRMLRWFGHAIRMRKGSGDMQGKQDDTLDAGAVLFGAVQPRFKAGGFDGVRRTKGVREKFTEQVFRIMVSETGMAPAQVSIAASDAKVWQKIRKNVLYRSIINDLREAKIWKYDQKAAIEVIKFWKSKLGINTWRANACEELLNMPTADQETQKHEDEQRERVVNGKSQIVAKKASELLPPPTKVQGNEDFKDARLLELQKNLERCNDGNGPNADEETGVHEATVEYLRANNFEIAGKKVVCKICNKSWGKRARGAMEAAARHAASHKNKPKPGEASQTKDAQPGKEVSGVDCRCKHGCVFHIKLDEQECGHSEKKATTLARRRMKVHEKKCPWRLCDNAGSQGGIVEKLMSGVSIEESKKSGHQQYRASGRYNHGAKVYTRTKAFKFKRGRKEAERRARLMAEKHLMGLEKEFIMKKLNKTARDDIDDKDDNQCVEEFWKLLFPDGGRQKAGETDKGVYSTLRRLR